MSQPVTLSISSAFDSGNIVVEQVDGDDVVLVLEQRVEVDHRVRAHAELAEERVRRDHAARAGRRPERPAHQVLGADLDDRPRVAVAVGDRREEDRVVEVLPAVHVLLADAPVLRDRALEVEPRHPVLPSLVVAVLGGAAPRRRRARAV